MKFKQKSSLLLLIFIFSQTVTQAQQKLKITLEDIWGKNTFAAKSVYGVNWMKDGRYYSSQAADNQNQAVDIVKVDVTTGKPVSTLIEGENLRLTNATAPLA